MKKERYLEHSTDTQREKPRAEKNYELGDSSQGLVLGPNQETFFTPVEGRINTYVVRGENCYRPAVPWVSCPLTF